MASYHATNFDRSPIGAALRNTRHYLTQLGNLARGHMQVAMELEAAAKVQVISGELSEDECNLVADVTWWLEGYLAGFDATNEHAPFTVKHIEAIRKAVRQGIEA